MHFLTPPCWATIKMKTESLSSNEEEAKEQIRLISSPYLWIFYLPNCRVLTSIRPSNQKGNTVWA